MIRVPSRLERSPYIARIADDSTVARRAKRRAAVHSSWIGEPRYRHGGSFRAIVYVLQGRLTSFFRRAETPIVTSVREGGFEPPRPSGHRILSPTRLPGSATLASAKRRPSGRRHSAGGDPRTPPPLRLGHFFQERTGAPDPEGGDPADRRDHDHDHEARAVAGRDAREPERRADKHQHRETHRRCEREPQLPRVSEQGEGPSGARGGDHRERDHGGAHEGGGRRSEERGRAHERRRAVGRSNRTSAAISTFRRSSASWSKSA